MTALPVILDKVLRLNTIQFRFNDVSIFGDNEPWWLTLLRNYSSYYDPAQFFFDGFRDGVGTRPFGVGEL